MALARIKTSNTLTLDGQLAAQEPQSRQRFNRSLTPSGFEKIREASPLSNTSLPRATSASLPVWANNGQTDWQEPQRMQTARSFSRDLTCSINVLMAPKMNRTHRFHVNFH